jgi:diguanylate cyclase (GGDEF)-like protein/PAS domain S-box-containing protein
MNSLTSAVEDRGTYYKTIVMVLPDAAMIILPNGSIVHANARAIQFFGLSDDPSSIGQSVFDIVQQVDHERAGIDIGNVIQNGEVHDAEYQIPRKDGAILWASVSAKLLHSPDDDRKTILILVRDISARKLAEESLRNLAVTDELTGLFNRRGFSLAAEQEVKHAFRRKEGLVLLFYDLDNLKMINDTFGHAEGDKAIKAAAKVLRSTFRESDIVARWGGDEFIVLALDVPEGRIPVLLQRLNHALRQINEKQTLPYGISFCKGIANFNPDSPLSLAEMQMQADEMMYREKQEKAHSRRLSFRAASEKVETSLP